MLISYSLQSQKRPLNSKPVTEEVAAMAETTVRVGIVGAGGNTRLRHIPGFRAIDGVELVGVVNSTPESTARAAAEFDIPRTYENWQTLVDDPELDAVMIGTWPNLHCEITVAALVAGKHVLCEARMACNASEAHRMLAASQAHPDLVAQIVPSPLGLPQHEFVCGLIDDGFLGEFRELVVVGIDDGFADTTRPLHWRQDAEISGMNILTMGILYETARRWSPAPERVFAQTATFEPERMAVGGSGSVPVTVPDSVQILTQLEGGGRGVYRFGGVHRHGPGRRIELYGSDGTIKLLLQDSERLLIGKSDGPLTEADIPAEQKGGWRVEEEFISAVRGNETVQFTDFATGVGYMEFTASVARSAQAGTAVDLPLTDVDN
jgi:predicted dehydrogenase